jgi:hypothetical protein
MPKDSFERACDGGHGRLDVVFNGAVCSSCRLASALGCNDRYATHRTTPQNALIGKFLAFIWCLGRALALNYDQFLGGKVACLQIFDK